MGDGNSDDRIVHLAARPGWGACGYVGKFTTTSPASVTCGECRKTWAFAAAQRSKRTGKAAAMSDDVLAKVRREVEDANSPRQEHRPGPKRMVGRRIHQDCWCCGQTWPCDGSWQARAETAEAKLAAIRARCRDTADAWTGPKDPDRPLTGAYALAVELLGIAGDEEGS